MINGRLSVVRWVLVFGLGPLVLGRDYVWFKRT